MTARLVGEERSPAPADVFEDRRRPRQRSGTCRWPAKDAVGRSSAVALDRTVGNVLVEPRHLADDRRGQIVRHRDRFDGLAEFPGAVGQPSRSPGSSCVSRSSASSTAIALAIIRRNASVVTQKPHTAPGCHRFAPTPRGSRPCRRRARPASRRSPQSQDLVAPSEHLRSLTQFATPIFESSGLIEDFAARPCSCGKPLLRPRSIVAGFRYPSIPPSAVPNKRSRCGAAATIIIWAAALSCLTRRTPSSFVAAIVSVSGNRWP